MLGVGWPELMVIAVVTVLVVGPKELPRVLRTVTQMMGKARAMAAEFQSGMEQLARESDLDDLRKEAIKIGKSTTEMTNDLDRSLDGDNAIAGMFTGTIGTPTAGAGLRAAELPKPAEPAGEVRIAGVTEATGPGPSLPPPATTATATATNVIPAPLPKKDVAAIETAVEPVSLEQRRAGA